MHLQTNTMREVEEEDEFGEKLVYVPGDDSDSDEESFLRATDSGGAGAEEPEKRETDSGEAGAGSEEPEKREASDDSDTDSSATKSETGARAATTHKPNKSNIEKLLTALRENDVRRAVYLVNIC